MEAIRRDIEDSRGENDRAYIQRAIAFQRCLDVAARLVIAGSRSKAGWVLGTTALAVAKSIENMELGHNICHGQWDWMNDPEIPQHLGVGHGRCLLAVTVFPQLPPPRVHQRHRDARPRIR